MLGWRGSLPSPERLCPTSSWEDEKDMKGSRATPEATDHHPSLGPRVSPWKAQTPPSTSCPFGGEVAGDGGAGGAAAGLRRRQVCPSLRLS